MREIFWIPTFMEWYSICTPCTYICAFSNNYYVSLNHALTKACLSSMNISVFQASLQSTNQPIILSIYLFMNPSIFLSIYQLFYWSILDLESPGNHCLETPKNKHTQLGSHTFPRWLGGADPPPPPPPTLPMMGLRTEGWLGHIVDHWRGGGGKWTRKARH